MKNIAMIAVALFGLVVFAPLASAGPIVCPPFNPGATTNLCVAANATTAGLNTPDVSGFTNTPICPVSSFCPVNLPVPVVTWVPTTIPDANLCGTYVWTSVTGNVYVASCKPIITGTANGLTNSVNALVGSISFGSSVSACEIIGCGWAPNLP